MKIGDLVIMPYKYSRDIRANVSATEIGVVVNTRNYSDPRNDRVRVYWFSYQEKAWEPKKWLEVVNGHS